MPRAREKVLVLCRATPEDSQEYGKTVCVAGLSAGGDFRRIYPVPFRQNTTGGGIAFHKKDWIEADLSPVDSARDKRAESRRIDMSTVSALRKATDSEVRSIIHAVLAPNIATLQATAASLGIIKPRLLDYMLDIESTKLTDGQLTLDDPENLGARRSLVKLGQASRYKFICPESKGCTCENQPHRLIILDWEVNELFRNIVKSDVQEAVIQAKMRAKLLDWMRDTREVYLLLGTHHIFKTWMVVSILYLRPPAPRATQSILGSLPSISNGN